VEKSIQDKKKETNGVSLRIPTTILTGLKTAAEKEQISLNTLANQIFQNYLDWDMNAANAGWVVLQRDTIKPIFGALDEKIIPEIAIPAADSLADALLLMRGEHTLDAFYHILRYRIAKSNFYLTDLALENNARKLVIQHDMGKKWSLFFKVYYERVLNNLGYEAKADYTANSLVLTVTEERK